MTKLEPIPLMALDASARRAHGEEIRVEQLAPDQGDMHADIAARAFGAPIDVFRRLAAPEILGLSELRAYVGLADDVPVTTAMAVTQGAFVGIFNVGTAEEHRRHGHGAAVTARAAADGFAAGARTAWLQSSAAGYGVYERLGFRTLEGWSCWVSSANE
jgi:ribosomal protein S18 acetylase RimI-like enzyme